MSDSSLDTMLSGAVVTRERTSEDNSSSDVTDNVRQGLAGDFTDSSERDFAVEHGDTVAARATAPVSDVNATGIEGASVGVGAAAPLPHPQPIWGHEEELSFQQPTVGQAAVGQPAEPQPSSRPAAGAAHSR